MPKNEMIIDNSWEPLDDPDEKPAPDHRAEYREQEIRAMQLNRKCL